MTALSIETALAVLGLAFTVWAGVVAWGVAVIRREVSDMKQTGKETGQALTSHVTQTERRLSMLEAEWRWMKEWLQELRRGDQHG